MNQPQGNPPRRGATLRRVASVIGDFFHRIGDEGTGPASPSAASANSNGPRAPSSTDLPRVRPRTTYGMPWLPEEPEEPPLRVPKKAGGANTVPNAQAKPPPRAAETPKARASPGPATTPTAQASLPLKATKTHSAQTPKTTPSFTAQSPPPSYPAQTPPFLRTGPIPRARPPPSSMPGSGARPSARPSAYVNPPAADPVNVHAALANAREMLESANTLGLGTTMQRIRVDKAMAMLRKIESQKLKEVDMVLVKGQLLVVQCKMLDLYFQDQITHKDVPEILYHIDGAITTRTQLRASPAFRQSSDFQRVLVHMLCDKSYATPANRQLLLRGLEDNLFKVSRTVKDPFLRVIHLEISCTLMREIFHDCVRQFEDGKWVRAMSLLSSKESALDVLVGLEDTYEAAWADVSVELGDHGLTNAYKLGDARALSDEFAMLLAMCKASQLLHLGDIHFEEAESGEPEEVFARALLAQDDYRAALNLVTGHDVELEGTVLYRLARFHSKVSKLHAVAHSLYLRAVQLATALAPTLPKGEWYLKCTEAVQAYRDELHAKDAKEWANKRQPILERMKDEIQKLEDASSMEDASFAKYVFKTWPPKTEGPKEFPVQATVDLSRAEHLKIIARYHTDKNSKFGEEWLVMCEEISKALVGRYNATKDM